MAIWQCWCFKRQLKTSFFNCAFNCDINSDFVQYIIVIFTLVVELRHYRNFIIIIEILLLL